MVSHVSICAPEVFVQPRLWKLEFHERDAVDVVALLLSGNHIHSDLLFFLP